jgi:acetyl-CoA carboxylase biotin carboxyl carrier protein
MQKEPKNSATNLKEIENLLDFISKSGLTEVSLETNQIKLTVKKRCDFLIPQQIESDNVSTLLKPNYQTTIQQINHQENNLQLNNHLQIKSPMVGTFYLFPKPNAPAFVKIGDRIVKGQKICIIEAMKLFNEIEAEVSGSIVSILIENATPVEYDQPLFIIDPS